MKTSKFWNGVNNRGYNLGRMFNREELIIYAYKYYGSETLLDTIDYCMTCDNTGEITHSNCGKSASMCCGGCEFIGVCPDC